MMNWLTNIITKVVPKQPYLVYAFKGLKNYIQLCVTYNAEFTMSSVQWTWSSVKCLLLLCERSSVGSYHGCFGLANTDTTFDVIRSVWAIYFQSFLECCWCTLLRSF